MQRLTGIFVKVSIFLSKYSGIFGYIFLTSTEPDISYLYSIHLNDKMIQLLDTLRVSLG